MMPRRGLLLLLLGALAGVAHSMSSKIEAQMQEMVQMESQMQAEMQMQSSLGLSTGWNWRYASDFFWLTKHISRSQGDIEKILFDIVNWKKRLNAETKKKMTASMPKGTNKKEPPTENIMERSWKTVSSSIKIQLEEGRGTRPAVTDENPPPHLDEEDMVASFLETQVQHLHTQADGMMAEMLSDVYSLLQLAHEEEAAAPADGAAAEQKDAGGIEDVVTAFLEQNEAVPAQPEQQAGKSGIEDVATAFLEMQTGTALETGTGSFLNGICREAKSARDLSWSNRDYMKVLHMNWNTEGVGQKRVSDRRLKTHIVQIGVSASQLPVYQYQYKEGVEGFDPAQKFYGTMAQDLLEMGRGDAVFKRDDGYYGVDYSKIDVDFRTSVELPASNPIFATPGAR